MTCDFQDTPRCPRTGCMHPHSVCMLSTHRINTAFIDRQKPALAVAGRVEQFEPAPEISRARLALNTYHLYRRVNCGRREALRNAWRALRQRT